MEGDGGWRRGFRRWFWPATAAAVVGLAAGCGHGAAPTAAAPTSITLVGGIQSEPNW